MAGRWLAAGLAAALLAAPEASAAQATPTELERERSYFSRWLWLAPTSPRNAIALQPIGAGLTLGRDMADVPLAGVAEHRVTETDGRVTLTGPEGTQVLPRGRPVPLGSYTLSAGGPAGRAVLVVFRSPGTGRGASFFPYDPAVVFEGTLAPPERAERRRVLGVDGIETDAIEAGMLSVPFGGSKIRLRVLRIPTPGTDESELEIFFRDGSNAAGSYPGGRFVALIPLGSGRYRLDFNRARNPFCAYSSAYPCPAPWRGNTIPVPVWAGERYLGGGLNSPAAGAEVE